MSALHNYVDLNGHSPISQQIHPLQSTKKQTYLTAPKDSTNRGKSHLRMIHKVCIQVIESKDSPLREKLKAAGILERLRHERVLAANRRRKLLTKNGGDKKRHSSDILCQVANG